MKRKIKFKQLIHEKTLGFWNEQDFEIIQWILNSSREFTTYTDGMHRELLGYSANNHNCFERFITPDQYHDDPINPKYRFLLAYSRAFVVPAHPDSVLGKWRKKERIDIDGAKMLNFSDDFPGEPSVGSFPRFEMSSEIRRLLQWKGKPLNKERFSSEIPDRINPFIKFIDFSIASAASDPFWWVVQIDFTFDMPGYEDNSWRYNFRQKEDESPARFFWRVNKEIAEELILQGS